MNIIASKKFINGPAIETNASAFVKEYFLSKFLELISTGFPHPNPTNIKHSKPTGSVWLNGFKFNLPCNLGVSSPSFVAIQAWANSWKVIAIITPGREYTKVAKFIPPVIRFISNIIPKKMYNVLLSNPKLNIFISFQILLFEILIL